jgi:hypothetical protein
MADKQRTKKRLSLPGVVRGVLAGLNSDGEPMVDFVHNPSGTPVLASTTVPVEASDIGKEVVLVLEDGDPTRPIMLGIVLAPRARESSRDTAGEEAQLAGKQLGISAEQEITLTCGAASITLTRAGKILIRGKYVLSRSSGVNRIKGGSVQIN